MLRYERAGDETVEDAPAWLCDHVVVEVTAATNQQLAVTEAPDVANIVRFEGVAVAPVTHAIWRPLAEPQPWREAALRFASINSVMALGRAKRRQVDALPLPGQRVHTKSRLARFGLRPALERPAGLRLTQTARWPLPRGDGRRRQF